MVASACTCAFSCPASRRSRCGALWTCVILWLVCGWGPAAEKVKVLLGHLPVTGHAKFFVAKEQGFFEEAGLDVELIEYTNSADGLSAVNSGKLDIGAFGTVAPLVYMAASEDIKIIGGVMGEDAYVVTTPDRAEKIGEPKDLAGLIVATVRLSSGDAVLRDALMRAGVSWQNDLLFVELSNPAAVLEALRNGQVDAGLVWGPYDLIASAGGFSVVMSTADMFPRHPCCRLVLTSKRYREMNDVWPRFLRAILRAENFARDPDKRDKTLEDIARYIPFPREMIEQSYYRGKLDQTSDPNTAAMERIWDILQSADFIHTQASVRDYIEVGPFLQALESLLASEPDEPYWRNVKRRFYEQNPPAMTGE